MGPQLFLPIFLSKLFLEKFSKRMANLVKLTLQIHIFPRTSPILCPKKDKISLKKSLKGTVGTTPKVS
jgi:hypothetical protein